MEGRITHVQHFSLHDGPGVRTTVFFAGCNLRCRWCHNPEAMWSVPRLQYFAARCSGCGGCATVCPAGAISGTPRNLDRGACLACGACATACLYGALSLSSHSADSDALLEDIAADTAFYQHTGGGATFSGGEPFLQPQFLAALLVGCREHNIPTAVETAADVEYAVIRPLLPLADVVLCDLKAVDGTLHWEGTGVSNVRILQNIARLAADAITLWVRIPLIPGYNDSPAELRHMADFLAGIPVARVEVLPYHQLGKAKYQSLGLPYTMNGTLPPTDKQLADAKAMLERG